MKFIVAAAAFLASTVCADRRTIVISDTIIRDYRGIRVVRFSLPTIHEKVFAAGPELGTAKRFPVPHFDYTWRVTGGDERFIVTLYENNKTGGMDDADGG
ncbi:hypothetical protein SLS58_007188 [Diplodia intermedia]|uniref:Uncharacterized protein n=1 Tax=Diplodia intermedia TaxID=856260 RepID=A0ABR3TLJ0_9PEZI